MEDRLSLLAGWLVTSHCALGLNVEKSVTRISLWPLGTLQTFLLIGSCS